MGTTIIRKIAGSLRAAPGDIAVLEMKASCLVGLSFLLQFSRNALKPQRVVEAYRNVFDECIRAVTRRVRWHYRAHATLDVGSASGAC